MNLRLEPGFLGTGASMLADLTLAAYVVLLVPAMLVGFFFARRKWFEPHHKLTMTTITIVNWLLIGALMISSYTQGVLPQLADNLSNPRYLLPTLHLITGALAQFTATYLVLRMWFEDQLPNSLKIRNIKTPMRFTLAAWLVTALLGAAIYVVWYTPQPAGAGDIPATTQEAPINAEATAESSPDATEEPAETPEASG
jgi:uncharacterized membrane protein YozB (DUF420 family)